MLLKSAIVCLVAIWASTANISARWQAAGASQPGSGPAFEVASIRRNTSGLAKNDWQALPGGTFTAINMNLRQLVQLAYGADIVINRPQQQVLGIQPWMNTERFDITAKAATDIATGPDGPTPQLRGMVRRLLEDRFNLKARVESREADIYELVFARADGQLGPRMLKSTIDCTRRSPANAADCALKSAGGALQARGVSIDMLVQFLSVSPAVGRIVRDRTQLTGTYDVTLEFVPPVALGAGGLTVNPAAETGLTVFTALQEQLGLKLQPARSPMPVLVVESASRPTEN